MEHEMTKTTQQSQNQRSDALNPNKGTAGNNQTNANANGNRGKQLNPNQTNKK
jgi:hypothetical protein